MKKLLELFTIGGVALVIAACGNGEEETDTGDETATEETGSVEESTDDTATEEETGSGSESEESAEESGTGSEDGTEEAESDEAGAGEDATTGEEQSKTFVLEEEGFVNELIYYYIDDEVQRQTSESDITYEALAVENEEQARELLEQESPDYEDVEGVEHSIEYGDEGVVETLEVDYTVADIAEISGLEGAEFDEEAEEAQFVSMEQSEEQLLNSGYELTEDEE